MEVANDLMAQARLFERTHHPGLSRSLRRGAATIRTLAEVRNPNDVAAVLFFLRGAAVEGQMFNAHRARDVFDAFARMLGLDPDEAWRRTE